VKGRARDVQGLIEWSSCASSGSSMCSAGPRCRRTTVNVFHNVIEPESKLRPRRSAVTLWPFALI